MNSPFVIEQARALAQRPLSSGAQISTEQRIEALYRQAYQRTPTPAELKRASEFLTQKPAGGTEGPWAAQEFGAYPPTADSMDPWQQFAQVLLLSNELLFID